MADALECLVSIASCDPSSSAAAGGVGAAAVLQLGGLEAATKALAAIAGSGTAGLGLSRSGSVRKSTDASANTSTGGLRGSLAAAAADAEGVLAQQEQRRVAMLAVRLVAILLQHGGTSRIQVLSGEFGQ